MVDLFRQHDPDPILTLAELVVMRALMVEKRTLLAKALGEAAGSKEFDYLLAVHEDFRRPTRHIILDVCK